MAKREEKAKVGRPKLAEPELIKDSWQNIASCLVVALVMVVCGSFTLAGVSITDFVSMASANKLQGNVLNTTVIPANKVEVIPANKVRVIPAKKTTTKVIKTNGEVSYIIPAKSVEVIKID